MFNQEVNFVKIMSPIYYLIAMFAYQLYKFLTP